MIVTAGTRAARLFLILSFVAVAAPLCDTAVAASPNAITNSTLDDGTAECSTRATPRSAGSPDANACRRSGQQPPMSRLYSRHYFGAAAE